MLPRSLVPVGVLRLAGYLPEASLLSPVQTTCSSRFGAAGPSHAGAGVPAGYQSESCGTGLKVLTAQLVTFNPFLVPSPAALT